MDMEAGEGAGPAQEKARMFRTRGPRGGGPPGPGAGARAVCPGGRGGSRVLPASPLLPAAPAAELIRTRLMSVMLPLGGFLN